MRYLSVCSGIEAVSCAVHPLGWRAAAFSEIDKFPSAVLKTRWPEVPNLGDMTCFKHWPDYAINLLVGGTPCQSFSVAGLRRGLADPRGNLALTFLAIAERYRPEWILWENVSGVLSDAGNAFGHFLAGLSELGYGWAYRVLDAQYFGLAQRRKRVFVVGYLGDWRRAAAVLFERASLCGNPPPSREAGQRTAGTLTGGASGGRSHGKKSGSDREGFLTTGTLSARTEGGGGLGTDLELSGGQTTAFGPASSLMAKDRRGVHSDMNNFVVGALTAKGPTAKGPTAMGAPEVDAGHYITHSLRGEGFDASEDGTGRGTPLVATAYRTSGNCGAWETGDKTDALTTGTDPNSHVLAFSCKDHGADAGDIAPTLRSMGHDGSHANGVGQLAVALTECSETDTCISYGQKTENDSVEALSDLREEIGEKAFSEWGLGILASFSPQEILQSAVHGSGLRCASIQEFGLVNYALSREEDRAERFVREMRSEERSGRASFGWEPHEQRSRQLAAYLSKLSQPGASAEKILRDLRQASKGAGVLRYPLSAVQKMGRPDASEGQSIHGDTKGIGEQPKKILQSSSVWESVSRERLLREARNAAPSRKTAVRRLTVEECEFLMGFPRGYTLIPRGKGMVADGPRYKALGNSMAVPVIAWIAKRIDLVRSLTSPRP